MQRKQIFLLLTWQYGEDSREGKVHEMQPQNVVGGPNVAYRVHEANNSGQERRLRKMGVLYLLNSCIFLILCTYLESYKESERCYIQKKSICQSTETLNIKILL